MSLKLDNPPWPKSLPGQTPLQWSQHKVHWHEREHIILALNDSFYRSLNAKALRLAECANTAALRVDVHARQVKPSLSCCHERMCPFCTKTRSAKLAAQFDTAIMAMTHPRFITLTIKHCTRPLAEQLATLISCWQRLGKWKVWRSLVAGGYCRLEIKVSDNDGLWHPHLHVLYDGSFFPVEQLRARWHKVTGASFIVDVRDVDDRQHAIAEITKYISKPEAVSTWSPTQIREYAQATAHKRMVIPFGNCYGKHPDEDHVESPHKQHHPALELARLVYLAKAGHDLPRRFLPLVAARWSGFTTYIRGQQLGLPHLDGVAQQYVRLRQLLRQRAPPSTATDTFALVKEQLDEEIFTLALEILDQENQGVYYEPTWSNFFTAQAA